MKKLASFIMSVALASTAFAGPVADSGKGGKMVMPPPPPSCDYFSPGAYLGIFAGGALPRTQGDLSNGDSFKDALGGGVLADYFFCKNFGVEVSYGAYATRGTFHVANAELIARAPIESLCIAPYIMAGGGIDADGSNDGEWNIGGGIEAHLTGRVGIFADGAYHFVDGSANKDFTLVRLGLKLHL